MGRIIHCADLVLKVDDDTVIGNISQWILESTEFRPTNMETCTIRDEMDTYQKLWLIMVVWLTLVLLSFLYCYFCEQRLFQGSQRLSSNTSSFNEAYLRLSSSISKDRSTSWPARPISPSRTSAILSSASSMRRLTSGKASTAALASSLLLATLV